MKKPFSKLLKIKLGIEFTIKGLSINDVRTGGSGQEMHMPRHKGTDHPLNGPSVVLFIFRTMLPTYAIALASELQIIAQKFSSIIRID
ncbi:hypothetical protein D3C79_679530 [compost metagenome]